MGKNHSPAVLFKANDIDTIQLLLFLFYLMSAFTAPVTHQDQGGCRCG
jgi:hypothetical protein